MVLENKRLLEKLSEAGWYKGRKLFDIGQIDPFYCEYYPKNILEFICEFGSLELESDITFTQYDDTGSNIGIKLEIKTVSGLDPISILQEYPKYNKNDNIDTSRFDKGDTDYYYSTLIGTNLYYIAHIGRDYSGLYMDEYNNIYCITHITDLCFLGNDIFNVFSMLLHFEKLSYKVLNESKLEWLKSKDDLDAIQLPINESLRLFNPWHWDYE